jgi:hypothetical protein
MAWNIGKGQMSDRRHKIKRKENLLKRCGETSYLTEQRARYRSIASGGAQGNGEEANTAAELEAAILELLNERQRGKSICPSEAAKRVGNKNSTHNWRELMGPTRAAAEKMAKDGKISITQKGQLIDICEATGPVRLQLP